MGTEAEMRQDQLSELAAWRERSAERSEELRARAHLRELARKFLNEVGAAAVEAGKLARPALEVLAMALVQQAIAEMKE